MNITKAYHSILKKAKAHRSILRKALFVVIGLVSVFAISPFITAIKTDAIVNEYRTIDGSGNNVANPNYGTPDTQLIRLADPAYEDGISVPRGGDVNSSLPNARTISNQVATQLAQEDRPNITNTTSMVFQWGQFVDHDIDLTEGKEGNFPIIVPPGDQFFPDGSVINLVRSIFDPNTGTSTNNPRQQINEITTWVDASNVYGSDEELAQFLREGTCGRLKISKNFDLLPSDADGNFIAGDIRAREQTGLVAIHTLFVREHNRLADIICKEYKKNPSWDDERIYQEARKEVGAQMQVITYKEFLPILLGPNNPLPNYSGYNPTIDPSIANEFSTAAFRFGHSTLTEELWLLKNNGKPIPFGNLPLADAFFRPNKFLFPNTLKGIEPVMRGLIKQPHMGVDNMIVDGVRNFLFGNPGAGGFDLAALNLQRGRDHGLPGYNAVREALGLPRKTSFSDISSKNNVNSKLESAYSSVDDIDLWIGGLAEDHVNGGLLGETFSAIIRDQFIRLRDGDRFWYQNNVFSNEKLNEIENTSLKDIIARNTKIKPRDIGNSAFRL